MKYLYLNHSNLRPASQNLSHLNNDDIHVSSSQSEEITVLRYQYEAILLLPPPPLLPSIAPASPGRLWSPSLDLESDQSSRLFCTNCFILTAACAQWLSQPFTITVIRCTSQNMQPHTHSVITLEADQSNNSIKCLLLLMTLARGKNEFI